MVRTAVGVPGVQGQVGTLSRRARPARETAQRSLLQAGTTWCAHPAWVNSVPCLERAANPRPLASDPPKELKANVENGLG